MTKTKDDKCNVCRHSGLAFLFLRHGAIGKEPASSIVPMGPAAPATDTNLVSAMQLPELKYSRYILRKLRPGYLYIYHEKIPKWLAAIRAKEKSKEPDAARWEVYRVTPSGALIPDYEAAFLTTDADFVCNTDPTHIFTAIAYRLRDAHASGKIRVAFSANLWNAKTKAQNKGNPEVMEIIDVPAILSGTLPKNAARPSAEWINKHVAEFALQDIRHGNLVPKHPLRAHYQEGARLEKRFAELDSVHKKTQGKSLALVLSDPAGTAIDLADISMGRYKIGVDHAEKQRHPAGAAIRLTMLQQQAKQAATVKLTVDPAKKNLLSSFLRRNAKGEIVSEAGRPIDVDGGRCVDGRRASLPPESERSKWEFVIRVSPAIVGHLVVTKQIPESACYFPYKGYGASEGVVFAPTADMDEIRIRQNTNATQFKMNTLYQRDQVTKFIDKFDGEMKAHQKAVDDHDGDRKAWVEHGRLKLCFKNHYDPYDQDTAAAYAYMKDACDVLTSWGGVSTSLEEVMRKLLDAEPSALDGWALRAMVANQEGIYSNLAEFWQHAVDWTTNIDNRLDKSYDSLKAVLFDDKGGLALEPRYAWFRTAGLGLSFGLMGFLSGAALHLSAQAIAKVAPDHAKNFEDAAKKLETLVEVRTGDIKDKVVAKELNRAMKIQAWCHQKALLVEGWLNKKPPARPVYARVTLTVAQAVEVLLDYRAEGIKLNKTVRKTLAAWQKLPESARSQTVELDFLTTDQALAEAQKPEAVIADAERVRLNTRQVKNPVVVVSVAALGDMYRKAHRFDGLNKALVGFVDKVTPQFAGRLNALSTLPGKAAVGAGRGAATWQGQFAFWGGVLQFRALLRNRAKLANLEKELEKIPNLSEADKIAISDEILMVQLGLADNYAGVTAGLSEMSAIGAQALKLTGTATLMNVVLSFAGAAGAFANAWQNWEKAEGKTREGDVVFVWAYRFVFGFFFLAGSALAVNGGALIIEWLSKRAALRAGVRFTAGRLLTFALTRLTVWGWVLTLVAFIIEGVVNWFDRTKLEAWVENCYFGDEPKFKGWQEEEAAFDAAMEDMRQQALRQGDGDLPDDATK